MPKKKAGKKKAVSPARAPHRGRRPKAVPIGSDVFCDILPPKKARKAAPKRRARAPAVPAKAPPAVGPSAPPAYPPPSVRIAHIASAARILARAKADADRNARVAWAQFSLYFAGVAALACDCPAAGLPLLLLGVLASFMRRG